MENYGFIFEIGDLIKEDQGTTRSFDINVKKQLDIGEDANLSSAVKTKVTLMRVEEGVNVEIENLEAKVEFICVRCMNRFEEKINIPHAERMFFFNKQKGDIDVFDTFYVDMKNMTIDISDFVRQEIILHFPLIPVCSKSCKGLCPYCGSNLNDTLCACSKKKKESPKTHKPLSDLKKLYNSANKDK